MLSVAACLPCKFCGSLLLIYHYVKENMHRKKYSTNLIMIFFLTKTSPRFQDGAKSNLSFSVNTTVKSFYNARNETIYVFVFSSSEFILHVILQFILHIIHLFLLLEKVLTQTLALHYILKPGTGASKKKKTKKTHPIKHIRSIQCKYNMY